MTEENLMKDMKMSQKMTYDFQKEKILGALHKTVLWGTVYKQFLILCLESDIPFIICAALLIVYYARILCGIATIIVNFFPFFFILKTVCDIYINCYSLLSTALLKKVSLVGAKCTSKLCTLITD